MEVVANDLPCTFFSPFDIQKYDKLLLLFFFDKNDISFIKMKTADLHPPTKGLGGTLVQCPTM